MPQLTNRKDNLIVILDGGPDNYIAMLTTARVLAPFVNVELYVEVSGMGHAVADRMEREGIKLTRVVKNVAGAFVLLDDRGTRV